MARFYGSMTNSRNKEVTAQGRSTGQEAHIRGWDAGVQIVSRPHGDGDSFTLYMTTGSHESGPRKFIGTVFSTPDGPEFIPAGIGVQLRGRGSK